MRLNVAEQYLQFGRVALRLIQDIVTISSPSSSHHVKVWMHAIVAPYVTALQSAQSRTAEADVNVTLDYSISIQILCIHSKHTIMR